MVAPSPGLRLFCVPGGITMSAKLRREEMANARHESVMERGGRPTSGGWERHAGETVSCGVEKQEAAASLSWAKA
eukprot:9283484-Pyramimonas_sp.AAC.1